MDTPFNVILGFSGGGGYAAAIAVQSNGKILIGGSFDQVNGVSRPYLARVEANGTLDTVFNAGATVGALTAVQSNGKILLASHDNSSMKIVRLEADGSRDNSFNVSVDPGPGNADVSISAVAVQGDTKIVIVGILGLVNGVARDTIARVEAANGTLDKSFPDVSVIQETIFGPRPGSVSTVAVQADGKIVIGGYFTLVNGVAHTNIARLEADGSLDSTFNVTISGFNVPSGSVETVAVKSDGKILLGGPFTIVNGVTRNYVARLNSDGSGGPIV